MGNNLSKFYHSNNNCEAANSRVKFSNTSDNGIELSNADVKSMGPINNDFASKSVSKIDKLHTECLSRVFKYMSVEDKFEIEKVCKKWKKAVHETWYQHTIDIKKLKEKLKNDDEILKNIITRCCHYVRHLIIDDINQYPWLHDILIDNCKNIIHFTININTVDQRVRALRETYVTSIIGSMINIQIIDVNVIYFMNADDGIFDRIVNNLRVEIKEIMFIASSRYSIVPNIPMYLNGPDLMKFTCLSCLLLHGFEWTNENFESILSSKETLIKLNLSNCFFPQNALQVFKNLENLEYLSLENAQGLSGNTKNLIRQLNIKYISI